MNTTFPMTVIDIICYQRFRYFDFFDAASYLRKYINRPFVLWFTINVFLALYPRLGNVNWHGSDGGDEARYHAGHEVTEDPVLDVACNRWLQRFSPASWPAPLGSDYRPVPSISCLAWLYVASWAALTTIARPMVGMAPLHRVVIPSSRYIRKRASNTFL